VAIVNNVVLAEVMLLFFCVVSRCCVPQVQADRHSLMNRIRSWLSVGCCVKQGVRLPDGLICHRGRSASPLRIAISKIHFVWEKNRMQQDWERLESWLRVHEAATLADLNDPATAADIQDMERQLGHVFPVSYSACLRIHAGQQGKAKWLFAGYEFLSPVNVILSWAAWNVLLQDGDLPTTSAQPDTGIQLVWWSRGWIPFASNGGGDFLCLDMTPALSGSEGQVIEVFHDFPARKRLAPDFSHWFSNFVADRLG
jgi:cell wall assembly regulator SMI1